MSHHHRYSCTDGVHCYDFVSSSLLLTLTPSHFIISDFGESLNLLCIDIVRKGNQMHTLAGHAICGILNRFMDANKNHALGYYPSCRDGKEKARIRLFEQWAMRYINRADVTNYTIVLRFAPTDTTRDYDELVLKVFAHDQYPFHTELIKQLNDFSQQIAAK